MSRVGENIRKVREASGLSAKALAKKMGVAESFLVDVELGRRVVNEAMLQRFSKVLGRNVSELGLDSFESAVFKEEKEEQRQVRVQTAQVQRPQAPVKPQERNELWDQAFGSNLKAVPIYDADFTRPVGNRLYPVENGKVSGIAADKAVILRHAGSDLTGYGIFPGSLLLGLPVKELNHSGFYLVETGGKKLLRKVRILGNGNVMLLQRQDQEISRALPLKDVKPLVYLLRVETELTGE